ncbi:MAG: AAA family ATPase [Chitinispirillaceae bacterium]|nr:AAA family ATPase [Chitinispirillaceae bacterium]
MRYIYVDNYRGFADCYIPIMDVNFMVGENSTGKTSILSLLNLLATPNFWFTLDFNQENTQLGCFRDIVSAESKNRDYFKIGIIECGENCNKKNAKQAYLFLLKFISKEGLPHVAQYSFLQDGIAYTTIFEDEKISYYDEKVEFGNNPKDNLMAVFKKWANVELKEKDLKKLDIQFNVSRLLIHLPSIIQSVISGSTSSNREKLRFGLRLPDFASNAAWIAPIRTKPKRTYDQYKFDFSPEGEHAPYLMKRLLNQKSISDSFQKFIKEFGSNSGLFKNIAVKKLGENPESPFQLDVMLNKSPINVEYVGYGVSQCLPIIVELFARPKSSWYFIQQPEVHLHPRAQATLGEIFFHFATKENKHFFIETHSDFTIDRYRVNIKKSSVVKHQSQVLFFERTTAGNSITSLPIDLKGAYPDSQPDTFRSFFINEEMRILGLE